ncbi:MAG: hypothetical protein CVU57_16190 [Deltaproteobacteria bacterium HGW-Deltaproteobacteria-15]|jgi:hypothetical protein|nr:MAG: hypothetical protein CVU57_16190 [Deltaproteobacteria bacterium HGW-Deltaproteobacteria-15]
MIRTDQNRLKATLTFTPGGEFDDAFLIAGNEREDAILWEAIGPALRALERRRLLQDQARHRLRELKARISADCSRPSAMGWAPYLSRTLNAFPGFSIDITEAEQE